MSIAGIGRSIRPPLGGPCPCVFQANNNGCLHFREHMALLWRAEHRTTPAINMALLRRAEENGQTPAPSIGPKGNGETREKAESFIKRYNRQGDQTPNAARR